MPALVPQLLARCSLGERGCGTQWQLRQHTSPAQQPSGLASLHSLPNCRCRPRPHSLPRCRCCPCPPRRSPTTTWRRRPRR